MTRPGSSGEQRAQERFGTSARAATFYAHQTLPHLNPQMQQFIARMDMVFIATADGKGACDCSFRAGEPGFVQLHDEKTLVCPEYRGNGVLASLGNILKNPHIGLIFPDFYQSAVGLHVNGSARVLNPTDTENLSHLSARIAEAAHVKGGCHPKAWVFIGVEEAYIHCSKHVPLLKRLDKHIAWGSDDEQAKGGNFFKVTP
ncbi:MAG TPA: pyridoxamine 5'-phosphate oxidase family protein [Nitrospira sp.]|nr:pyridoxamine 5'-phosphate oxidase family protein [Nitrospira sp.]